MNYSFTSITLFAFFLHLLLFICPLSGQQNGDFESWSPSGSPPPFNWIFPTGWTANNATTEFITAGVTRNTYHYSGEFAAQIKTLNIFGTLRRSQLALGNCQLDYSNYQVRAYSGGESLPMIPDQVSFYYQLTIGAPAEYAVAEVLIKRPSGSSIPDTVYHGTLELPAVDIYTQAHLSITESGINPATDSIVILFSSNDTNEVASNILYVDDVSIDFASSINHLPESQPALIAYPNPVKTGESLNIKIDDDKMHQLQLLDHTGRRLECCFDMTYEGEDLHLSPLDLTPGIYTIILDGRNAYRFVVSD